MALNSDTTPSNLNYALFEGSSIKQYIIEQLNESGVFIDQNYLGSNLNAFLDVIGVTLQQLLFHYNATASESTFATASLFENMNKITSLLNYKPSGRLTSILPAITTCTLNTTGVGGTYVIPRYAYINYNNSYVLRNDVPVYVEGVEPQRFSSVLYQGTIQESPVMLTTGEDFQTFTIVDTEIKTTSGKFVSDNFFDVYVKEPSRSHWLEFAEVKSLYDASGTQCVFERRLNENYSYDFKFGNNINGYKPESGSQVVIFYLVSDGKSGEVGAGTIESLRLHYFNSENYSSIFLNGITSIHSTQPNYMSSEELNYCRVTDSGDSTPVTAIESVDITRNYVPKLFASQNRLLTQSDYTAYIKKNFINSVKDCYVMNNDEYTSSFMKYYYDIGLKAPNDDPRVCLNQVLFQTSCGFNNVYAVLLPAISTIVNGVVPNYVNETLKQMIVNDIDPYKGISHNIVPIDPIYKAVKLAIVREDNNTVPEDFDDVYLQVVKSKYSNFSNDYIAKAVEDVIVEYFDSLTLGSAVNINELSNKILQVSGVKRIQMTDGVNVQDTLTMLVWNPLYQEEDFEVVQQNVPMEPYMYPFFYNIQNINSKIIITNE